MSIFDIKGLEDTHGAVGSGKGTSPERLTVMIEQEPVDTNPNLL